MCVSFDQLNTTMNLMFRKNFREGAKSSASGVKLTSKANRSQGKRSRDMGYGNLDADCHYRTHLFFSPNRGFNSNDCEGLCDFAMCLSMPFNLSPSLYFSSYSLCPPIYTYLSLSLCVHSCSILFYFVHTTFTTSTSIAYQ